MKAEKTNPDSVKEKEPIEIVEEMKQEGHNANEITQYLGKHYYGVIDDD